MKRRIKVGMVILSLMAIQSCGSLLGLVGGVATVYGLANLPDMGPTEPSGSRKRRVCAATDNSGGIRRCIDWRDEYY